MKNNRIQAIIIAFLVIIDKLITIITLNFKKTYIALKFANWCIQRDRRRNDLPSAKDLIELEKDRVPWSLKTFKKSTALSTLIHLESEIEEIRININKGVKDPVEYADAMMCLLDSAARTGITVEEILFAYAEKIQINKKRKWHRNDDNTYFHVKD